MKVYNGLTCNATFNTNGFQGGDAGHGGSTIIRFIGNDQGSIYLDGEELNSKKEHVLTFLGDWELVDLMNVCKSLLNYLEEYTGIKADENLQMNSEIYQTDSIFDVI